MFQVNGHENSLSHEIGSLVVQEKLLNVHKRPRCPIICRLQLFNLNINAEESLEKIKIIILDF